MIEVKKQLHALCRAYVQQRIANAEAIIADAREAAKNETKSSAGDKYETAREMMQQDIDMNMRRIAEAKAQLLVLEQIDIGKTQDLVVPGSIVITTVTNYYISISAGVQSINDVSYQCVSIASPIATKMKGAKTTDRFDMNGKEQIIKAIY